METDPARRAPAHRPDDRPDPGPARLESGALLAGRPEVEILHGGEVYRLRCTRAGKLILTK